MPMKLWHQSFTVLGDLPGYEDAMRAHLTKVLRPDTEVVFHGQANGTYRTIRATISAMATRSGYTAINGLPRAALRRNRSSTPTPCARCQTRCCGRFARWSTYR